MLDNVDMITYFDILILILMSGFSLAFSYFIRKEPLIFSTISSAIITSTGVFYIISYLSPVSLIDACLSILIVSLVYLLPRYLRNPHEILTLLVYPLLEYIALAMITFLWLF